MVWSIDVPAAFKFELYLLHFVRNENVVTYGQVHSQRVSLHDVHVMPSIAELRSALQAVSILGFPMTLSHPHHS